MIALTTCSRITIHIHGSLSRNLMNTLRGVGINDFHMIPARSVIIEVKKGIFSLLPGKDLSNDPVDIFFFLVDKRMEEHLLKFIVEKMQLNFPGRGSVLSEDVRVSCRDEADGERHPTPISVEDIHTKFYPYSGICCIVQRGHGENLARVALDRGTCTPSIHFGTGTGIRDKMGLLRITIPHEKEIIHVFSARYESDPILDTMIDRGKLDQPGRGYIYQYHINRGFINMKVARGGLRQAASIEQIVTALDHIKGGTEWRRSSRAGELKPLREKQYITGLCDFLLLCDAGTGTELVKTAMAAGAGGATITSLRFLRSADSPNKDIPPAREACDMVIPETLTESVLEALDHAGAFTDRCHARIQIREISKAFTYTGPS